MVLPLVALGLLGAGYAGKNVMGDFFDERREKRQGARFDEAMAGAAPGMENRALASAGLLDPNEWATMQQRTAEGALDRGAAWDRMAFGEAGVNNRFERGMAFDEMQAQNEALRAEGQRVFEATSTLRDEYQPQLDRYSDFIAENDGINTLLADIREMNPAERDLWIKSQDAVAAQAQLAEAQERQFTAWITENKPAGDAPSAEEIERLRGSFLQAEGDIVDMFTNKRFDQAIEINNRRKRPIWSAGSDARGSIQPRPRRGHQRHGPALLPQSRPHPAS